MFCLTPYCIFADVKLCLTINSFLSMAKGIHVFGQVRGKLGGMVMYRANGEQISRAKAASVKNPKTTGQMIQRMLFGTVAAAYARMKSITDHSFEGVQYGA